MATPSPNLTTSRIARLFRPLRAKCKQLVAIVENTIPKPRHSAPSIYTSRQKTKGMNQSMIYISPSGFPLTIIPPPHRLTSFGYLDSTSKHHAKLSKALYDVRDAYQHVLQACFVTTTSKQGLQSESTTSRTLSLATLCAIVLGRAVEEEVRLSRSGEKEAEDEEDVTVIGEIYDSVLPQHRP